MPWTLPATPPARRAPSRRSVLTATAAAAGAALLTGCSGEDGATARSAEERGIPLERRMRESAVRDTERLLERYDATTAAHPDLAGRLAPLRAAVAAHPAALAFPAAGKPERSAAPSASPSASAPGAPSRSAAPAGTPVKVPQSAADALTELADAERSLAEARTIALAGAPGELARLLASVAACGAVHAYLLTSTPSTPGAAS